MVEVLRIALVIYFGCAFGSFVSMVALITFEKIILGTTVIEIVADGKESEFFVFVLTLLSILWVALLWPRVLADFIIGLISKK